MEQSELNDMLGISNPVDLEDEIPEKIDEGIEGEEEVEEVEEIIAEDDSSAQDEELENEEVVSEKEEELSEEEESEAEAPITAREKALLDRLEQVTGERLELRAGKPLEAPLDLKDLEKVDFVGEEDVDDILSDKESLNRFALKIAKQAIEATSQQMMRRVPEVVNSQFQHQTSLQEVVNDFYDINPELRGVKRTVAAVANEIGEKEPELSINELMTKAADETRKLLQIPRGGNKSSPKQKTGKKPAFVGGQNVRKKEGSGPKLEGLVKEVNDLISL